MIDQLTYIIVEDEYFALENLKSIIAELRPGWRLAFTSESVDEAVRFFNEGGKCDMAFMDVELVDGTCFEIFSKAVVEVPVIFTTAYDEYAIKAFKVNSVDYILKPVSAAAARSAIEKFERWEESHPRQPVDYKSITASLASLNTGRKRLLISQGDEYSVIDVSEVAYFVSEEKYVFAVDFSGRRNITEYANLNQLEEDIDGNRFFRAARNVVVSVRAVQRVHKYFNGRLKVTVKDGQGQLPVIVSAARRDAFLTWLGS